MRVHPDDLSLPRSRPNTAKIDKVIAACAEGCVLLLLALILSALLIFITACAAGKHPYGTVPIIEIDSITVSNFNLSNPISAHWNINMTMHSTDSSFEFSDSAVSIFHKSKEEALWMTKLNGFDMRPKNTTVHFALDFGGLADVNDTTVRAIGEQVTNNYHGVAVEFIVQFKADHSRSRNISPVKKFFYNYATMVNMLGSCEVLFLFGSTDKTRAFMLKTKDQAGMSVDYSFP